jgi:hypothetical protein
MEDNGNQYFLEQMPIINQLLELINWHLLPQLIRFALKT